MTPDRLSIIITKGGDNGTTSLGGGKRVPKDACRIEAYGTVDELNSFVGIVRQVPDLPEKLHQPLEEIQHDLFIIGGELCFEAEEAQKYQIVGISSEKVQQLESWAAEINKTLPPLKEFILPTGPHGAAELHVARTVCRRAERRVVTLTSLETVRPEAVMYLNRLSDLLFIWSRWVMEVVNKSPTYWNRPTHD